MRCPFCGSHNTQVKDSRPTEDNSAIRRRRSCPDCDGRFTTFERVQLRELTVVKRNGRRVPFDRDKLARSIDISIRKRPIEQDVAERMISDLVRDFETRGDPEIRSTEIGTAVLEALKALDTVAFVRFASVYQDFKNARDFKGILEDIASSSEESGDGSN